MKKYIIRSPRSESFNYNIWLQDGYKCRPQKSSTAPVSGPQSKELVRGKEVNKEQSRPTEIFQPPQQGFYSVHVHAVAASQKYFSAIHTSPHLTLAFVNNIILHLLLVLCTAVNVRNKN
jgi:hypothetical protein